MVGNNHTANGHTEQPDTQADDLRSGRAGENELQERFGTMERALRFYENSLHDHLTDVMQRFIAERIMFFVATADATGATDCSPRVGPRGFVTVLDETHLAYPEYRGNGVHASLGNLLTNPAATLLFVDWWETTIGLHVNGQATLHDECPEADDPTETDTTTVWVELEVEEAYIHCAKHIPRLSIEMFDPPWGTDDLDGKKAEFFAE